MQIFNILGSKFFVVYGTLSYLSLSVLLRNIVAKDHWRGVGLVNRNDLKAAIPLFEKSYAFFKENEWVDRYRYLTVMSSSKLSYQEMALLNLGFCYKQLGNEEKSKEYYGRAVNEFPESHS